MVSYVAKKTLQKLGRPRGGDTNMEVSAPPAEILAAVDHHGVLAPSFQGLRGRDELIEAMGNRRLASAPSQLNLEPRNIEVWGFSLSQNCEHPYGVGPNTESHLGLKTNIWKEGHLHIHPSLIWSQVWFRFAHHGLYLNYPKSKLKSSV